jgi:hypothetical protein
MLAGLAGFGCVAWYAVAAAPSPQAGLTALGVALTALIIGGLLGLLFGLPRAHVRIPDSPIDGSTTSNYDHQRFTTNTNLEEVSDWLTKIIVGVGLIQFKDIITQIEQFVNFLGSSLGGNAEAFALVLILYFPSLGFVIGYIWSRVSFLQVITAFTERRG